MEPLKPRITKSTAVPAIKARFPKTSDMLKRFELAKAQANLWDGERDGLREAVKTLDAGKYDDVSLSWTPTAPVLYPNADGKYQLESTLQTNIPPTDHERVIVFAGPETPKLFLDQILHNLQTSKEMALNYLHNIYVGTGDTVNNGLLYERKASSKSTIIVE